MNARLNIRPRPQGARTPAHKFAVGATVFHTIGHRRERLSFQITRLLPDGGGGLQYRLRCDNDGHERVAVETSLERRDPEDLV